MLENILVGKSNMEIQQWKRIIEKMYDEEDFRQLELQLSSKLSQQAKSPKEQAKSTRRQGPLSRTELQQQSIPQPGKLKFVTFLKCVLDFQLLEHERFLSMFVRHFKSIDSDRDGVLSED
jgi:hypothetical protein